MERRGGESEPGDISPLCAAKLTGDNWGPLSHPHSTNEAEAGARQGPDQPLLAGIANCATSRVQSGRQRGIRDDAPFPNDIDKLVLADDALRVADQIIEQVENLRRRRDQLSPAS